MTMFDKSTHHTLITIIVSTCILPTAFTSWAYDCHAVCWVHGLEYFDKTISYTLANTNN